MMVGDTNAPCSHCQQHGRQCSNEQPVLFSPLQWRPEAGSLVDQTDKAAPTSHNAVTFINETQAISRQYKVTTDPSTIDETGRLTSGHAPSVRKSNGTDHVLTDDAGFLSLGNPITNKKDAFYMSRYVQHLGPWFDLFDNHDRHFSYLVPALALNNRLLQLSCLAAAARQYSLVSGCGDGDALLYYDEALRTLTSFLDDRAHETATFASCLLIAHCEMIESKANDWNLHLKGTRELVVAQGWNGCSGGLAQACFWIYCRMMILSSMSAGTPTPIDTAHWLPSGSFTDPSQWTIDSWACKTVYLLGIAHNFLCRTRRTSDLEVVEANKREWNELAVMIRHHEAVCPPTCRPLSIVKQQPLLEIGYTNGSIAAAWQIYHTLVLAHCICAPCLPTERLENLHAASSAAQEYAELIIANSMANRFDTAWVNAVQLLTTAGQCLTGWQTRHACTTALEDIRRATGWNTKENLTVLFETWDQKASVRSPVRATRTANLLLHLLEAQD